MAQKDMHKAAQGCECSSPVHRVLCVHPPQGAQAATTGGAGNHQVGGQSMRYIGGTAAQCARDSIDRNYFAAVSNFAEICRFHGLIP
jgi:hypothetical protein